MSEIKVQMREGFALWWAPKRVSVLRWCSGQIGHSELSNGAERSKKTLEKLLSLAMRKSPHLGGRNLFLTVSLALSHRQRGDDEDDDVDEIPKRGAALI